MSAEGAKFELVIYNLPEDAQRLAVNLSGEKNDNIQVTDALRDANGNITLEIGSTAYPFKALSQPGEHTVRVTYQDGAGAWPQIGEVGSLTVKPATPVLSSSEDTISSGDGYTLTFTDDVKNEYGCNLRIRLPGRSDRHLWRLDADGGKNRNHPSCLFAGRGNLYHRRARAVGRRV